MKLSEQQIERIRARIAEREAADAVQLVVDGGDLDRGRVSLSEFIALERITLEADEIAALIVAPDGDYAERIRERVETWCKELVRDWFETARGQEWLERVVQEAMDAEKEAAEEEDYDARADARLMRDMGKA